MHQRGNCIADVVAQSRALIEQSEILIEMSRTLRELSKIARHRQIKTCVMAHNGDSQGPSHDDNKDEPPS